LPTKAKTHWEANNWYRDGGSVWGPGSGTSDSIPAWLSNGEFVVNAAQARKNRGVLAAINAGADVVPSAGGAGQVINHTWNITGGNADEIGRKVQSTQRQAARRYTGRP